MDPYLEKPSLWPGLHLRIIATAGDMLVERLRPRFIVTIEERVYVSDDSDTARHVIVPDLTVMELPEQRVRVIPTDDGGTVEVAEPIVMQTLLDEEIREARLEILDAQSRSVITVIEVLSPANKISRAHGYDSYYRKRNEIMNSPVHLVEIDLLRAGLTFMPTPALPLGDYFVHISRAGTKERPNGDVWPIHLEERLPIIHIPLRPPEQHVDLDLQAVLNSVYDRGAYDLLVDYRGEPDPLLTPEQAEWAHELLKKKGLR